MQISTVGVVGSGIMGAGVAEVAILSGFDVVLRSRREGSALGARTGIEKALDRRVERGRLAVDERDAALRRLRATAALHELEACDLVIEAVVEDLPTKRELFGELDRVCHDGTLLATNTSTFSVTELAVQTRRPARVCGLHFFNPAPVMTLVEVARTMMADDATIDTATDFVRACGKEPVVVTDSTGFIVNALLFGYFGDAIRLLERGTATIADIDTAMRGGCGFPMGPFELLDLIGLDTAAAVFDALFAERREPRLACPPRLRRMVSAGQLGRKSGHGFYDHRR
jgi:3-hydroxybutyryl-CoA dehydrogenase